MAAIRRIKALWVITAAVLLFTALPLAACELPVRDAAFRMPRDVHQLCVISRGEDEQADAIHGELEAWLSDAARDLNVTLVRVDADDPEVEWSRFGLPSAPPSTPVVVLAGRNHGTGENFYVQHWEPGPTIEELHSLLTSPVRDELGQQLGKDVAVVLYSSADGTGSAVNGIVARTVDKWKDRTRLPITAIPLDRADPTERALLAFAGIRPDGPDWAGVVFGLGKLMNPPLVGEEITEEALDKLLEQVLADCACSKPVPSLGVDLPMVWTSEHDETVITLVDPEADAEAETEAALTSLGTFAESHSDEMAEHGAATSGSLLATVLWTLGGAVCLVVVTATFIVCKRAGN